MKQCKDDAEFQSLFWWNYKFKHAYMISVITLQFKFQSLFWWNYKFKPREPALQVFTVRVSILVLVEL